MASQGTTAVRGGRVTAGAPLDVLVKCLARADWGVLQGREFNGVRNVLRALADLLPSWSGEGVATVFQISRVCGHCTRWVRVVLHWLEDADLIVWWRGGVFQGTPRPGLIRVNKWRLVELIRAARPVHDACQKAQQERTRARIAKLGRPTLKNRVVRLCRSTHEELATALPFTRKSKRAHDGAAPSPSTLITPIVKEEKSMKYPNINIEDLPKKCRHVSGIPARCPECRALAMRGINEGRNTQPATVQQSGGIHVVASDGKILTNDARPVTVEPFELIQEEIPAKSHAMTVKTDKVALRKELDAYMARKYKNADRARYLNALRMDPYARALHEQIAQYS